MEEAVLASTKKKLRCITNNNANYQKAMRYLAR